MTELEKLLIEDEGLRLKPYRCTAGKLTIGVGRNIEDNGITEKEAIFLLKNDLERCAEELIEVFGSNSLAHILWNKRRFLDKDQEKWNGREKVLMAMIFNLGKTRFLTFKKMIEAVKNEEWDKAADEMLDSKWAKQVPNRAKKLAEMMRGV